MIAVFLRHLLKRKREDTDYVSEGTVTACPPADGPLYRVITGDTLEVVVSAFEDATPAVQKEYADGWMILNSKVGFIDTGKEQGKVYARLLTFVKNPGAM